MTVNNISESGLFGLGPSDSFALPICYVGVIVVAFSFLLISIHLLTDIVCLCACRGVCVFNLDL